MEIVGTPENFRFSKNIKLYSLGYEATIITKYVSYIIFKILLEMCENSKILDRVGSGRVGSVRVGSDRIGSDRIGSDWVGSGRIESRILLGIGLGSLKYLVIRDC